MDVKIQNFGHIIDSNIRKKHRTLTGYCENKKKSLQSTNKILNNLKNGNGCNLTTLISILTDLNLELVIQEKPKQTN